MQNDRYLSLSVLLLFLMLWFPLGQYSFLVENWMKIGTYAIPFLLIGLFTFRHNKTPLFKDFKVLSVFMLVFYLIHQFEEHWVDLYGNQYAFYESANNSFKSILGHDGKKDMPLTKEAIFVINTSLVWLVGALAILRAPKHIFPSLAMASVILVNAFVHILPAVQKLSYNPGTLTALIIFIPFSVYYYWYVLKTDILLKRQVIAAIIWGVLAHFIMMAGMVLANWKGIIPEIVYFAALIAWSCIPFFMFRKTEFKVNPERD